MRAELWERRRAVLGGRVPELGLDRGPSTELDQAIPALIDLPQGVVTAIHTSQWEINNNFRGIFERERDGGKPALVVLLGYSNVLRDVVKTVVWKHLGKADRLFVVRLDESDFGTRQMEFELREDREWYRPGDSPQFGVGEGGLLQSLYESEADWRVYVLLDGDCFDLKGRVVQSLDKRRELKRLDKWAKGRIKKFVMVEGYKVYGDLTEVPDFFRDDLDAIGLIDRWAWRLTVVGDSFVRDLRT